jgi:hypothetical protein
VKTVWELNQSAANSGRRELLPVLVEATARLGQNDRAIAIERLRVADATKPEDKAAIEKRIAELTASEKTRQLRQLLMTRVDRSNAVQSIYASRILGN